MKITLLSRIILFFLLMNLLISFVNANIKEDIEIFSEEIEEFIGDKKAIFFVGEYASPSEKLTFRYLQKNHEKAEEAKIYYNLEDLENLNLKNKTIILIGGENQNSLSKKIL